MIFMTPSPDFLVAAFGFSSGNPIGMKANGCDGFSTISSRSRLFLEQKGTLIQQAQ
jgi:hypothetical protein